MLRWQQVQLGQDFLIRSQPKQSKQGKHKKLRTIHSNPKLDGLNPAASIRIVPLKKVLAYKNEDVVHRFVDFYDVSLRDSREIFQETKKWLWFCASMRARELKNAQVPKMIFPLFNEAYAIDCMWHVFLLYSEDYETFCHRHFGFFIHHHPKRLKDYRKWQRQLKTNSKRAMHDKEVEMERVCRAISVELGVSTLKKWCLDFPKRFQL